MHHGRWAQQKVIRELLESIEHQIGFLKAFPCVKEPFPTPKSTRTIIFVLSGVHFWNAAKPQPSDPAAHTQPHSKRSPNTT